MPFDGNPAKFVKPEVFSLPGLIAWLETQEPAAAYRYSSAGDCLLCRYFRANGQDVFVLNRFGFYRRNALSVKIAYPDAMAAACNADPQTYGAALSRARQLLATA